MKLRTGKKLGAMLLVLCAVLALQGCSCVRTRQEGTCPEQRQEKTGETDKMEKVLEQVLEALNDHDAEKLKALFSEYALRNIPDMDQKIQDLLNFFQGPSTGSQPSSSVREWHSAFGQEVDGNSLGHGLECYRAAYTVDTDSGDYKLRMLFYAINEEDPSLGGLFLLEIAEMERYNESGFRFSDGTAPDIVCYGAN